MPRRPDLPCADCGNLMWRGKGVLPEGQARCRECRTARPSRPSFDPAKCGTPRGRDQHRHRGEAPCEACRLAWNAATRERLARLRASGHRSPSKGQLVTKSGAACIACGERVIGKVTSDKPMHNACRPEKFWANAIQISDRDRNAIYERDGWTCQLCGGPVDPSLDPCRDGMAATLDHIVPRSMTLFPDDSPENLRLAHRACNSARGNRVAA